MPRTPIAAVVRSRSGVRTTTWSMCVTPFGCPPGPGSPVALAASGPAFTATVVGSPSRTPSPSSPLSPGRRRGRLRRRPHRRRPAHRPRRGGRVSRRSAPAPFVVGADQAKAHRAEPGTCRRRRRSPRMPGRPGRRPRRPRSTGPALRPSPATLLAAQYHEHRQRWQGTALIAGSWPRCQAGGRCWPASGRRAGPAVRRRAGRRPDLDLLGAARHQQFPAVDAVGQPVVVGQHSRHPQHVGHQVVGNAVSSPTSSKRPSPW